MVVIRLSRGGAKKTPFYHIVATTKSNKRDGRYNECVGYFNPLAKGQAVRLKVELDRIDYWVSVGAKLSPRVNSLVKQARKEQAQVAA